MPPLLPILLPIVLTAIVAAVMFSRFLPAPKPIAAEPAPRFIDVTAESGITFQHAPGANPDDVPTTLGGAVVSFDYNRDGRPDLFFVNGTAWPWESRGAWTRTGACALYRNEGDGRFTDVSGEAGLQLVLQGVAAAAGDFDADGWPDLLVTAVGECRLLRNQGDGTFVDVTEAAGVGGESNTWNTGATWIDYDNDGHLDLVVAQYARWPQDLGLGGAFSVAAMGRSYGTPTGFLGAFPLVYRNSGDGRFLRVPDGAGLRPVDPQTGLPVLGMLAVLPVDANGDAALDLLFSFQTVGPALFLNRGDGSFRPWQGGREVRHEGAAAGLATTSVLASGDRGTGERLLALRAAAQLAGAEPDLASLPAKFAVAVFDYDHDGNLEVFSTGARAEPDIGRLERRAEFAGAPALYWKNGDTWAPAETPEGGATGWARPLVARGVASLDFDGDGSVDLVFVPHAGRPVLLRNDQRRELPWLQIDLVGTRSHPDAFGARVEVHTPRGVLMQTRVPAMGFLAQSSSDLTFGLGEDARVRKIVVNWPGGTRQEIVPEGVNRRIVITEK